MAISRSIRVTSVGKIKTICEGEQKVCLDICLGYTERYLRVAEIRRIDVLFVGSSVCHFWCWMLCVALAHSCIVYGDHCRIGVLSVVIVTVVLESACSTDTVLCCIWESLFN